MISAHDIDAMRLEPVVIWETRRSHLDEPYIVVYVDGQPVQRITKGYRMVEAARDALNGKYVVPSPYGPEPITVIDHRWLLRFASELCRAAIPLVGLRV